MPHSGFQLVLDGLARVVGGTVNPNDATFFSGNLAGDSTGVAGVKGCFSVKPDNLQTTPVGVLIPDTFTQSDPLQGEQNNEDWVTLVLYVARYDAKAQGALLNSFRDLIPAAFHSHMTAFGTAYG